MPAETHYVGVDLGRTRDFTAIAVIQRVIESQPVKDSPIAYPAPRLVPFYHLRELVRMRGVSYSKVVERLVEFMNHVELRYDAALVVDMTGVGQAVFDMMISAGLDPVGVTIHGGLHVTQRISTLEDGTGYGVPKHDLVASLQVLFQQDRIRFSPQLEHLKALVDELANFRIKSTDRGNLRYEASGAEDHDDLVIATSLAAWYGQLNEDRDTTLRRFKRPEVGTRYDPFSRVGKQHDRVG